MTFHATKRTRTDRHLHGLAGIAGLEAALQAVGGRHGNAANDAARKLRLNLEQGLDVPDGRLVLNDERAVDGRHRAGELNVHNRADDAHDAAGAGAMRVALGRCRLLGGDSISH